jgi:gliding motility-associated-like protein
MGDITPCQDTVCTGLEVQYSVTGNQNSIFDWHLDVGGVIQTNQTNDCIVNWGSISGSYTLSVQEITSEGCEGVIKTCEVVVVEPDITFNSTYNICLNQTINLSANPLGGDWSGDYVNGNTFVGLDNGEFYPSYNVNIYGCDYQESVLVEVEPEYIKPTLTYSKILLDFCYDSNQQVYSVLDDRSVNFVWSIDNMFESENNTLMVNWQDITDTYYISVYGIDNIGCKSDTTGLYVRTQSCQALYAPNSFTPNGDGTNDIFKITGLSIYEPTLRIFNRWGVEVYNSTTLIWNGDGGNGYYCNSDVYNWTVTYKDKNGFKKESNGFIVLIR